ncbi:SymE family type I addiction module toxin [uncultured Microbulbifer sp.]
MPWITIRGHWLERAGFVVDTPIKVRVRVIERCLVLTAE